MVFWWHHDLFWQESLCMHMVDWAGVTLSTKADAPIVPFLQREKWQPQSRTVTFSPCTSMHPHVKPARMLFILKTGINYIRIYVKYAIYKNVYSNKLEYTQNNNIYMTSSGSKASFVFISQQCEWHFWVISLFANQLVDTNQCSYRSV